MPPVEATFTGACILAIPLTLGALFTGLIAPLLLGIAVLFLVPALIALFAYRRPHGPSLVVALTSLTAFFTIFFVPVWVAAARAKTPADHLRVGEAYARRGQLFSNYAKTWEHYLIAAKGGDPEAQCRVGEAYLFGHYRVSKDRNQALQWLTAAHSQRHARAAEVLPYAYTGP